MTTQGNLISQIKTALERKAAATPENIEPIVFYVMIEGKPTLEYVALKGMSWMEFSNSALNINDSFSCTDIGDGNGSLGITFTIPFFTSNIYLIYADKNGTFITNPIIENGMTVYAISI